MKRDRCSRHEKQRWSKNQQLMTTKAQALTIITLGATLAIASAQTTQTTAAAPATPPPALSSTEQTIKDIKTPFSWMNWGADLRLRNEYFYDVITLNPHVPLHEQDYFRFQIGRASCRERV